MTRTTTAAARQQVNEGDQGRRGAAIECLGRRQLALDRERRPVRAVQMEVDVLHVEEQGRGDPIVFLHGLGGTTRYWQEGIEPLSTRARVVRLDLLGFGESPKPWCRYTPERHLAAVKNATDHLPPMTMVGHSMGAALALAFAARHPHRVRRLILLGLPYFGTRSLAYRYYRRSPTSAWWATNVGLFVAGCILTRRVLARLLPLVLTDLPRVVAQDLVKHTWRSAMSSLWNVLYDHDLAVDAAALRSDLPVCCVHGETDKMAPLDGLRRLASGRPGWTVLTLSDVDHHPWLRDGATCRGAIVAHHESR